nr:ABC transporter permease [Saccharomonospora saliphila]
MVKGFVRDKASLFFTFLFPLVFLVVFGLLFGDAGGSRTQIGVVGGGTVVSEIRGAEALDVRSFDTTEEAEERVRSGDLPAYVTQEDDEVTVRFAASDQDTAGTVVGIVDGIVNRANVAATGQEPVYRLDASQVEDTSLRPIQYMAPGILSFAVAMASVFGTALTLVNWRRHQVLRRLRLAPVSPATVLTSRLLLTLGIACAQFVLFIGIALLPAFGLRLTGQWWLAIPLLALGSVAFFAVGMLVGAACTTEEAANGAANLVTLPMAFLSGSFFPMDLAPEWLRAVSLVLPMRHLNDGMLDVMVRGQGPEALLAPALVLVGFTVVLGGLAARLFRWNP